MYGQINISDSLAGQTLKAFLDAFNSGDRSKIQAYIQSFEPRSGRAEFPPPDVHLLMKFRGRTGGFDLLSIDANESLFIKFRVKERASSTLAVGVLKLRDGPPTTVDTFTLRAIPPGAEVEDVVLDVQGRRRVINGADAILKEFYVFPDMAQKMSDALGNHLRSGDYDAITDGAIFAVLLTEHLRAVSHDKHLEVIYNPFKLPAGKPEPSAADQETQMTKEMQRINCGFEKIEILPGNIGYLKFNMFAIPTVCGSTATAAMNFLSHVDAIIFDLRDNCGGDPMMIALISSYLFNHPTHLNDIYDRKEDTTTQYWTLPFVPGVRLSDKPAFVLTSKNTFSGAEEFSYNNLKNLKRAMIIGELRNPLISRTA